jgi:hypothetical protein
MPELNMQWCSLAFNQEVVYLVQASTCVATMQLTTLECEHNKKQQNATKQLHAPLQRREHSSASCPHHPGAINGSTSE